MPGKEFYRWQVRTLTVLLALDAVNRMSYALRPPRINPSEEQGGLLFGRILGDNVIEVTDFEFVRSSHRRGVSYDLSPLERSRIGQRVQALSRRNGPAPVGYFRTHLRPGLFLDQSDVALMADTFDQSGITLAVRVNQQGPEEAGIFFQENEEIDGREPGLKFPFDAEALRVQGPIEVGGRTDATGAGEAFSRLSVSRKTLVSAGIYAVAGGILALATITGMHEHGQSGARASAAAVVSAAEPGSSEALAAPPPVFSDDPPDSDDPDTADLTTPGSRTPFGSPPIDIGVSPRKAEGSDDAPPFRQFAPPPPERTAVVIPPAAPAPVQPRESSSSQSTTSSTSLPAAPPPSVPEPVATAPPPRNVVAVNVSIEPKEDGVLKRAARRVPEAIGHVPLLGRLPGLRRDRDENVIAARPSADLSPRIPANLSRNLSEEVEVDVEASIDEQGAVRNVEVMRGDDAELASAAEDAVRAARWKPARSGDRNVAMNVVVHYRFNPGLREGPNASTARTSVSPEPRF